MVPRVTIALRYAPWRCHRRRDPFSLHIRLPLLELRVLGPISLKRSDGSTVSSLLAQPKRFALAAYLAAPPPLGGRCFHKKDTLIGMFWPELDQTRARAALRNSLYFLRTALGPEAVRTGPDDSVGLDQAVLWCDLDAFDVAVRIRDAATAHQLYRRWRA